MLSLLPAASVFVLSAALTAPAQAQSLQGENARDIARVTAPSLAQVNALRAAITAGAVGRLSPSITIVPDNPEDQILLWHTLALDVTAVDHTSQLNDAGQQVNLEQFGPHRTSRALAIIHIAMFEVANAYAPQYKSWIARSGGSPAAAPRGASEAAAVIGAAYATLVDLYPNLQSQLQQQRDMALSHLTASASAVAVGESYGEAVGQQVFNLRVNDGSQLPEPRWGVDFTPRQPLGPDGTYPKGQWQIDPVSNIATALGGNWPAVTPFVLSAGSQFRGTVPNPPAPDLSNPDYQVPFNAVYSLGADARRNLERVDTPNGDNYFRAKFWAYDATAGLCAPVRLYNQISDQVLQTYQHTIAPDLGTPRHAAAAAEVARYYALANAAMADAGLAAWDAKYYFQYWRPVTGIRYEQTLVNKGGAAKYPIFYHSEVWYPLGAQSTNSVAGYNITPPFPAYPSGHAVFGGALFQVLRMLVPNDSGFSFQSDEFNGSGSLGPNIDAYNFERCKDGDLSPVYCKPLKFKSFTDAEYDNAQSRVWMGVHWQFDADAGIALGEKVGQFAYTSAFQPLS